MLLHAMMRFLNLLHTGLDDAVVHPCKTVIQQQIAGWLASGEKWKKLSKTAQEI